MLETKNPSFVTLLIFTLLFLIDPQTSRSEGVWRTASHCASAPLTGRISIDCSTISSDAISYCYDSFVDPYQATFIAITMYASNKVACSIQHKWNNQGWYWYGKNYGDDKCQLGETKDTETGQCVKEETCTVGNPIDILSGNKEHIEADFSFYRSGRAININRYYSSRRGAITAYSTSDAKDWYFEYEFQLQFLPVYIGSDYKPHFIVREPNGNKIIFKLSSDEVYSPIDNKYSDLTPVYENGQIIARRFKNNITNEQYVFDQNNNFIEYSDGAGFVLNLVNEEYLLSTSFQHNGTEIFRYERDSGGKVTKLVLFENITFVYVYDSKSRLIAVNTPYNTSKTYHYEDETHPFLLTGVTDENNVRYQTWEYDTFGRAILSKHSTNSDKTTVDYTNIGISDFPSVSFINALDKKTTLHFASIANAQRKIRVEGHPSTNCIASNKGFTYYSNGFIQTKTDWNGNVTYFERDNEGKKILEVRGYRWINNNPQFGEVTDVLSYLEKPNSLESLKSVKTCWHSAFDLPEKIITSQQVEIFSYFPDGKLKSKQIAYRTEENSECSQ